jgi:hypothetical protein
MIFMISINPPSTGRGTRRRNLKAGMRNREVMTDVIRVSFIFFFWT